MRDLFDPKIDRIPLAETTVVCIQMLRRFLDYAARADGDQLRLDFARAAYAILSDLEGCGVLTKAEAAEWDAQWNAAYREGAGSSSAVFDFAAAQRAKERDRAATILSVGNGMH